MLLLASVSEHVAEINRALLMLTRALSLSFMLFGPLVAAGVNRNCNCCVPSLVFSLSLACDLSEDLRYSVSGFGFPPVFC